MNRRGFLRLSLAGALSAPVSVPLTWDELAKAHPLDFRIAKNFKFGSTRSMISADLYNVMNANPVISYNNSFTPNGSWLQPNSILTGRLVRMESAPGKILTSLRRRRWKRGVSASRVRRVADLPCHRTITP